jgi:hypothetical protein
VSCFTRNAAAGASRNGRTSAQIESSFIERVYGHGANETDYAYNRKEKLRPRRLDPRPDDPDRHAAARTIGMRMIGMNDLSPQARTPTRATVRHGAIIGAGGDR